MIGRIIAFELYHRLKNPMFYLFIGMMIFQGSWYIKSTYDYYANDVVLMNASTIIYKILAGGGMIYVILISIISGAIIFRDIEYKTSHHLYTYPMDEKVFFVGKFLAALCTNVILSIGLIIGLVLSPYSGIATQELFGPTPIWQILEAFVLLTFPNLFLLTATSIAPIVLTKKSFAGHLAILFITIIFVITESVSVNTSDTSLLEVLDPFGYVYTAQVLDTVVPIHKNTTFLPITSNYFFNKIIWLMVATIMLVWAYRKFSFTYFITATQEKEKKQATSTATLPFQKRISLSKLNFNFSFLGNIKVALSLCYQEFLNVVRPKAFKIVFGITVAMFFLNNLLLNASYYIGPQQPLTTHMTHSRIVLGVFIILLLMIWITELLFQNKTYKVWQLIDSSYMPTWVQMTAKYLAMALVAFMLAGCIVISGIFSQLLNGFSNIEYGLYVIDVFGYQWGWLSYLTFMSLPFFIAGVTGNRFATHIISTGIFIFLIISFDMGILEDIRIGFGLVPGIEDYSEIAKYGIFAISAAYVGTLWGVLALILLALGVYFWKRGMKNDWLYKLSFRGNQLHLFSKIALLALLVVFVSLQNIISQDIFDNKNFTFTHEEEDDKATYEKQYKYIEDIPQARYSAVDMQVDIFPTQRLLSYSASIKLTNPHSTTIDSLFINMSEHSKIESIKIGGKAMTPIWQNDRFDLYAYSLPNPLHPYDTSTMQIQVRKQYLGYTVNDAQADLTFNGTVTQRDLLPIIGYDSDKELDENRKRKAYGLNSIVARMSTVDDSTMLQQNYFSPDANLITGTITVSTNNNQLPITAGKLVKSWQENNRNFATYTLDTPTYLDIPIASANYQKTTQNLNGVTATLWHKKAHKYNLTRYQKAVREGLRFINKNLSEYPYSELNIVEIPKYQESFYANPNLILISENEGWYADTQQVKEQCYLHFTVVTQLAKQWLLHRANIANVQGAEMIVTALPQAIALQSTFELFGKEQVEILLTKKLSYYQKHRNNESNKELPLLYADNADYLENNKGVVELYKLSKLIGFEIFNNILVKYKNEYKGSHTTFEALYNNLLNEVSSTENQKLVRTWFETSDLRLQ